MIDIDKIEDAWIEDIKANIDGVKTVDSHEVPYDEKLISAMLAFAPFILIRWGSAFSPTATGMASGAAGTLEPRFFVTIGTQSLRSRKEGRLGAYSILQTMMERYNGFTFKFEDGTATLTLSAGDFYDSQLGLIVYELEFSYSDSLL